MSKAQHVLERCVKKSINDNSKPHGCANLIAGHVALAYNFEAAADYFLHKISVSTHQNKSNLVFFKYPRQFLPRSVLSGPTPDPGIRKSEIFVISVDNPAKKSIKELETGGQVQGVTGSWCSRLVVTS